MRKALAKMAVIAGIAMIPAMPAYAGEEWQANDDDALLLEVRSGQWRLGDGVRGYQTDTGICVDFADLIIALDIPVRLDKKSRRATGWLFEENRRIDIDRDNESVDIMGNVHPLNPGDIRDTPDGWCVDTRNLAAWLDVDVTPDLPNALLMLKADRKLPFELAEERKARAGKFKPASAYDLASLPQADDPYRFWRTPSIDVVASTGFQKENGGKSRFERRYEIYASGEVAGASFNARLASDIEGTPETLRITAYRSDPDGQLLGPLQATHFSVGDVSTISTPLGVQTNAGRGAFVTNQPLGRADSFDKTTFRGELPDGWDAELYRNDQLIGYTQNRGDGRYEFLDVDLLFGQNQFEVVLYGPQGQVRRDVKTIPVGVNSIPSRQTYYWAGVQEAGRDLVDFGSRAFQDNVGWRGGIGLERGIDTKTSIAASFTTANFRQSRRHYLEASLRRALGPALVEISSASDLAGGSALRTQLLAQVGQTLISAETAWFMNDFQSERFDLNLRRLHRLALDHNIKIGGAYIPVHLEAEQKIRSNGDEVFEAKSRLSFNINKLNASTELIWEAPKSAFGGNPPQRLDMIYRLSGRLGKVRLRGETQFGLSRDKGLQESKLTAEWRATERSDWRAELGYDARLSRSRVAIAHIRRFGQFALSGQLEAASDGAIAANLNLAFSFGPNPAEGGLRFSSQKLATNGQALAIVFYDENADGIRQPNEPTEEAVELTAGLSGRSAPTDKNGQSFIDGLEPFQPVLIGIDDSSLPDPFVQPANSGIVVTPRPGIAFIVELPLVAAGEISGTLQHENGRILTGVEVELINDKGQVVKNTRSEFDGYFLFDRVPYGRYMVRIATLSAEIVHVQTQLPGFVVIDKDQPSVDVGRVIANGVRQIAYGASAELSAQVTP